MLSTPRIKNPIDGKGCLEAVDILSHVGVEARLAPIVWARLASFVESKDHSGEVGGLRLATLGPTPLAR